MQYWYKLFLLCPVSRTHFHLKTKISFLLISTLAHIHLHTHTCKQTVERYYKPYLPRIASSGILEAKKDVGRNEDRKFSGIIERRNEVTYKYKAMKINSEEK